MTSTPTKMPFPFREPQPDRFGLRHSLGLALLLLMLLFWLMDQFGWFSFEMDPATLAQLQQEQALLQRDMVFRFVDSPPDDLTPKPDAALSDADRQAKSKTEEELEPENNDPFSRGDTYELTDSEGGSPSEPLPSTKAQKADPDTASNVSESPLKPPAPVMQAKQEREKKKTDTEEGTTESSPQGNLPTWSGMPKPYQPPSQTTVAEAESQAQQALRSLSQQSEAQRTAQEGKRHQNLQGKRMPHIGFSVDTAGHELGPYLQRLIDLVRSNWRIPNIARLEASGVTAIAFDLYQDGSIKEARVYSESGFEALDAASLNAITNTHPAPPLPQHIKEASIPIEFGFYYNVRPPRP
jgi:TonB family protein